MLQQRSGRINHDIRLRGADSRYHCFVLKARPVVNAEGEVVRVIGALSDVTEIKAAEERILHDAIHDNLTGLPNRELFFDRLGAALIQAERARRADARRRWRSTSTASRRSTTRSAWRSAIRRCSTVARRLGRELKPGDTLARMGGDQFGVIVHARRRRGRDRAASSNRSRALMAAPISFGDREVALTVSIGVALVRPRPAHQGRRSARRRGNRARQRQEGGRRPRRDLRRATCGPTRSDRQSLADDLRHALDRGEITVMFQPIVRLEDRTVAGFEALPRWRHPRLGLLGPDDFFSLAEPNERARRNRRLRHRDDGARTRGLAEGARGHAADLRQHQRLVAPDARPTTCSATCAPRSTATTCCAAR